MRVAIYCRISADSTERGEGVERQEQDCRALVERKGWTVDRVLIENDVSASTNSNKPRPVYAAMLAAAAAGEIDAVVGYSNSRLTRRPRETEDLIELHRNHGTLISTVVSGDDDLSTADGRQNARIRASIDAGEAERTSERVRRQKAQRAASGKPMGTRFRTFGYERDWTVRDDEAEIVREVFSRAIRGETVGAITRDLQARGVRSAAGGTWVRLQTARMLANPRYAGIVMFRGERVAVASTVPAIVSEAEFTAAQRPGVKRSHGNARTYLLSGFLLCGSCMRPMVGGSGRYRCDSATGGCGGCSILAEWADAPIVSRVTGYHQQQRTTEPVEAPDVSATLASIDAEIAAAIAANAAGHLKIQHLTPILDGLDRRRAETVASAAQQVSTVSHVFRGMDEWDLAELGERREIVGLYLHRAVIAPCGKGRQPHKGRGRIAPHWTNGTAEPDMLREMSPLMQWYAGDAQSVG